MSDYGLCECGCGQRTAIAKKNDKSRQMVKGEPRRFLPNHHARITNRSRRSLSDSDYAVEDHGHETPCWIWLGAQRGAGYGKVGIRGRYVAAHRAYYEECVGPIPDGFEVDHLCFVRLCVNPAHLEAVTHEENVRRASERRISHELIARIRATTGTLVPLAQEVGISVTHAYDIRNRKARA